MGRDWWWGVGEGAGPGWTMKGQGFLFVQCGWVEPQRVSEWAGLRAEHLQAEQVTEEAADWLRLLLLSL